MKVQNNNHQFLDAETKIDSIDGIYGLILESRGGVKEYLVIVGMKIILKH